MKRLTLVALLFMMLLTPACGRLMRDSSSGENGSGQNATGDLDAENDQTDENTPVDNLDVCSHLTRDEVEAALGRPVMEPRRGTELTSRRSGTLNSSCMFGGDEGFVSVGIKRQDPRSTTTDWNAARAFEELRERIRNARGEGSPVRLENVSGFGAGAFAEIKEETKNFQTTELRVLSRYSILTVRVVGLLAATSTLEAAKTLAGKALPRLEQNERDGTIPEPVSRPKAAKPVANLKDDDRSKESERSQNEGRSKKGTEQSSARNTSQAASKQANRNGSRRANETNSREGRKAGKASAERTAAKAKREDARATKAKPRGRRRP